MTGHEEDPFTDALVDAVARKTLPLAQAAIQLRLMRHRGTDGPELPDVMRELREKVDVRREQTLEMPASDPVTRLDSLAAHETVAAGIDRGLPDDPSTPNIDESLHGLEDAARHQGYADSVNAVASMRSRASDTRPVRRTTRVATGPTPARTITASRTRSPSRRAR